MKKWLCASILPVALAIGCGAGVKEVKPSAEGPPKDTGVASKGMQDAMSNPNMPPEMREKMKQMNKGMPGAPGGAAPGGAAPGGAAPGGAAPAGAAPAETPAK